MNISVGRPEIGQWYAPPTRANRFESSDAMTARAHRNRVVRWVSCHASPSAANGCNGCAQFSADDPDASERGK
jgi:hypothetical protein